MSETPLARPRFGRLCAIGLVVLSPIYAEYLSGYGGQTGDPVALVGGLLLLGPLYGCAALLIREAARRHGLRWPGILTLALGFAILQAGVIDQSMFSTSYGQVDYWDDLRLPTYIEAIGVAPAMALSFLAGHVVWSFGAPIALMEAVQGDRVPQPWLRLPGLVLTTLLYLAAAVLILADHLKNEVDHASAAQVAWSLAVVALLFAAAFAFRRRAPRRGETSPPKPRTTGLLALLAATGFVLLPETWLGFAARVAIASAAGWLLLAASRSAMWGGRHTASVAGGAVIAMALVAFLVEPLGDVPHAAKFAHNAFLLTASLALIAWAARRQAETSLTELGGDAAAHGRDGVDGAQHRPEGGAGEAIGGSGLPGIAQ